MEEAGAASARAVPAQFSFRRRELQGAREEVQAEGPAAHSRGSGPVDAPPSMHVDPAHSSSRRTVRRRIEPQTWS